MRLLVAATLVAAACSDGGGGGDDEPVSDAGPSVDAGDDDCQLVPSEVTCQGLDGAWAFENVSRSANTISLEGDLAVSAGGAMMVAFGEPRPDATFDQDIYTAGSAECGWAPTAPLTQDSEVQNTYPSLVVEGETFHLVWSGYPEGLNDVYYAANSGAGWTDRVNLTADYESEMMRHAYAPSISIGPGGAIAIAYLSAPADAEGGFDGPAEVRVATLEADTLAAPPETVIAAGDDGCVNPRAIHDGDGHLHVVAECGAIFAQDIVWATDDGPGPWQSEPLPGTADHDDLSVTVALAGGTVHAAWVADLPCSDGTCRTLQHSVLTGGSWSPPANASQGGAPADFAPSLAIAADGTIYIAFWRDNADNKADVYLTSSSDGESFAPPCNLTRTEADNEWMPSSLQIHPGSGTLHLLYEAFVPDSEPLDTEVIHAFIL